MKKLIFRKLTLNEQIEFNKRVCLLLYGGLDYADKQGWNNSMWFHIENPYATEAVGMYQTLEVLGYGFFGSDDNKNEFNLRYKFLQIQAAVQEKGLTLSAAGAYKWFTENE